VGRHAVTGIAPQKAIFKASGTTGWHRHDLRRTGATMIGEAGIPPYVIEAALNHSTINTDLSGRYNVARYRDDVKDALQALSAQYIRLIERVETRDCGRDLQPKL
jgi:integrase